MMNTKLVEMNTAQPTIIIEQNGQPTTVVMSYDYYQGLLDQLQKWKPLAATDPFQQASTQFWNNLSLNELSSVRPVHDIDELLGPEPPEEEESADEFIADIRQWRKEPDFQSLYACKIGLFSFLGQRRGKII